MKKRCSPNDWILFEKSIPDGAIYNGLDACACFGVGGGKSVPFRVYTIGDWACQENFFPLASY
jgi:hypothetical protein